MFKDNRPLIWSGKRYFVNCIGEITTNTGEKIKPIFKDNEYFVQLDWVLGRQKYSVAILVLFAFNLIKVQDFHIDKIIPLYRDGNSKNLSPSNLLYKFKSGKIEIDNYPGFYYIPFYVNYGINEKGDILNINTGKFKSWSETKPNLEKKQTGGYLYTRVVDDFGFSKTLFQHRALCYVFKNYENDVEELVVNHIDGNPRNNTISNLELVTYQRNNLHAIEIGLRSDNKPILVRNLLTGEILRFNSKYECGRYYGQPKAGFVVHRLKHGIGKIYSDMLQFKYDDGTPWIEIDLSKTKIERSGKSEDIIARNVFTGNSIIFSGAPNGFHYTGVKADTITSHIRENKVIPINGWNFRWLSEDIEWPIHTEKHLKVYAKYPIYPPDGAIVLNIESNDELFYESVSLACQALKINKRLFYQYANDKKILSNKYKLELFKLRENLGHPIEKSIEK